MSARPEEDEGRRRTGLDDLAASTTLGSVRAFRPADAAGDQLVGHASSIQ